MTLLRYVNLKNTSKIINVLYFLGILLYAKSKPYIYASP